MVAHKAGEAPVRRRRRWRMRPSLTKGLIWGFFVEVAALTLALLAYSLIWSWWIQR